MQKNMEEICLKHDNGSDLQFRGRLFSECSWYDEEHGMLTRQKLYVTDNNEQVYYIVRSSARNAAAMPIACRCAAIIASLTTA